MTIRQNRCYIYLVTLCFSMEVFGQLPGVGTYELLDVTTQPAVVSEDQNFELVFSGYNILQPSAGTTTVEGDTIYVKGPPQLCFAAGNPPYPPNDRPSVVTVPINGLTAGTYQVEGDWSEDCFGQIASLESEVVIYPNSGAVIFNHESPAEGQVVSGVSVIRGWACYPEGKGQVGKVTFTIDDDSFHSSLPYGSIRNDTREVCGYNFDQIAQTGYGGVVYWAGVGSGGDHTLTIYIDGEEVDSVKFTIASPPPTSVPEDIGFRKGAEGEYLIDEFLGTQESVIIRWSEADQNFIIVEYN